MVVTLFDVSGTIWNDTEQVFRANYEALREKGISTFPNTFPNEEYIGAEITPDNLRENAVGSAPEMLRMCGLNGNDSYLMNLYLRKLNEVSFGVPPKLYNGIVPLLQELSKNNYVSQMGIISSHPQVRLDEDLQRFGLYEMFNSIQGSINDKTRSIKDVVSQSQGKDVLYIGDTISDMKSANLAGTISLGVSYGYQPREKVLEGKPAYLAGSVSELEEILFNNILNSDIPERVAYRT